VAVPELQRGEAQQVRALAFHLGAKIIHP
jgi:hypothetical protein